MKKLVGVMAAVVLFCLPLTANAEWRFPLGLTYVGGFSDVVDLFKDNLRYKGYSVDSSGGVPVGLSFHPYYQWSSGLGMGVGFGPAMMIMVDSSSNSYDLTIVPFSAEVRYVFNLQGSASPYLRAGGTYLYANGDFKNSVQPGAFGAAGIEFMRDRRVAVGIEAGYDSSVVKMQRLRNNTSESIHPIGFFASLYVDF
ncbi:MAG TPA: outer membrane beta-barrel protein [Nitrospirota bacterium]|nr:outer membrane beta-barrel protein [Nitrospirota bacterium]